MWLKRRTPQNIVIGGAAGAFPPMIGWSIVSGGMSLESVLMFLLIFIWTPPHFWTLALFMKQDYSRAKVPMLTVTHGTAVTRTNILGYTILLFTISVIIGFSNLGGPLYLFICLPLNIWFLVKSVEIFQRSDIQSKFDDFKLEKQTFLFSVFYLFIHFGMIGVETILKKFVFDYPVWTQLF